MKANRHHFKHLPSSKLKRTISFQNQHNKKSCCLRIGPRNDVNCERLSSLSGTFRPWTKEVKYLGIYLVSSKRLKISTEHSRRSFYRAANAIFGKIVRIATEEVVLHLLLSECVPILLYGLEACSIRKTDLDSLDFVVNRFFMNNEIVSY